MLQQELGTREKMLETVTRFREDQIAYSTLCLRIRDKDSNLVPLKPNDPQLIVEEKLNAQWDETGRIRAVILKARQEGVSTWVAGRFFKRLHLMAGQKGLIVTDELDRSGSLFGIYDRFYNHLPRELKPEKIAYGAQKKLGFSHDSELAVRPSTDTAAGRSHTIHLLHASELAFWAPTQIRDTWKSLMQSVPGRGSEVIVESTPNGAGGLFHDLWEKSQQPGSPWIGIFLPWWILAEYEEDPLRSEIEAIEQNADDFELRALGEGIPWEGQNYVLSLRKLAWRRRKIVENFGGDPLYLGKDATRDFMQEYPATAEEAFLMSGNCYFDEDSLHRMAQEDTRESILVGRLSESVVKNREGQETGKAILFDKSARGMVEVWERPDPEAHYVIGCDTATGKLVTGSRTSSDTAAMEHGGRDYTSATVLKLGVKGTSVPTIAAMLHGGIQHDIAARQLDLLGRWYKCGGIDPKRKRQDTSEDEALIAVESNHSSGQRVLEYLKDIIRYRRLYWQREINARTKLFERRVGWRTDERSRIILIDTLAEMIRKAEITVPDKNTVRELTTFVVHDDGKPAAEEGTHDDRVISLALAVQMISEHRHAFTRKPKAFTERATNE